MSFQKVQVPSHAIEPIKRAVGKRNLGTPEPHSTGLSGQRSSNTIYELQDEGEDSFDVPCTIERYLVLRPPPNQFLHTKLGQSDPYERTRDTYVDRLIPKLSQQVPDG